MTRYRIFVHQGGAWHVADTFTNWLDVLAAMNHCEQSGLKAIVVVRDGPIDRAIMGTGRLPKHIKEQIVQVGRNLLAERAAKKPPFMEY